MNIYKRLLTLLLPILLIPFYSGGQVETGKNFRDGAPVSYSDSLWMISLPVVKLPDGYRNRELPDVLDNSVYEYFRPIFSQEGATCGQSAGIGYNFTYEINRVRDLPADTAINQYPTHFAWNFMNGGYGWYGVSYLHSFEILRVLGTPTVFEYGGMFIDDGQAWITGYDKYYYAMKNRVEKVSQIQVGDPEGLLVLKHWLYDHLDGSGIGGVANFYASSPWNYQTLPPQSPEAGKKVMVQFYGTVATHAMTIVGYNDSIRFDYNNDGQFTNHIDINNDAVVDMKDWEIGAVKFANSYGNDWANEGYCYMMYKVLADELSDGGIWNHCVHILDVKATYEPELTMKVTLKHDSRDKIRVKAGISADTAATWPEHMVTFPVFNFQGGPLYMQGGREEETKKTIEFGLDLTSLLSYAEPGKPARVFLLIDEDDPSHEGSGVVISYSIMDYSNGMVEVKCPDENVPIPDNGSMKLSVVHTFNFDKVTITDNELPAVVTGQPYEHQFTAVDGTPPYTWELEVPYYQQSFAAAFPVIEDVPLVPSSQYLPYAEQEIAFDFPFYDGTCNKLYIHQDGYILMGGEIYPWPYYNDPFLLFRSMKTISVFLCKPVKYFPPPTDGDGMWYEGDENHAAFRWSKPIMSADEEIGHAEFAVILYPDGIIEYYYNDIDVTEDILWYAGVSYGNRVDYKMIGASNTSLLPRKGGVRLIPDFPPPGISLSETGLLTGNPMIPVTDNPIYNATVKVTDDKSISAIKSFQLSDGVIFSYSLQAGEDSVVQYGETVAVDVTVKNISTMFFNNVQGVASVDDPNLTVIDGYFNIGSLPPGATMLVSDALAFEVSGNCPDKYTFLVDVDIQSTQKDWHGKMIFTAQAPGLFLQKVRVADNNNNKLDPGETVNVYLTISNDGSSQANMVAGTLWSADPYITVNSPSQVSYGTLLTGESKEMAFSVSADTGTPISHLAGFTFSISSEPDLTIEENFNLLIGQWPVLVINRAQNNNSSSAIISALQGLGVEYKVSDTIPGVLELYRSIFVCLGTFYSNTPLTQDEGSALATYLNLGGKLYMEGTITWKMDPQTEVHPKFGIGVESINWTSFDQLRGVPGTAYENLLFDFTGEFHMINYYLTPASTAFPMFRLDTSSVYNTTIANDAEIFRTIGSNLEFGSFESSNTILDRKVFLKNMLIFFGLEEYIVNVPERGNEIDFKPISVFPNPFTHDVHIVFEISEKSEAEISILNISGQVVAKILPVTHLDPGKHDFTWNATDEKGNAVPPGIYFYSSSIAGKFQTGKLILIR